MIPGTILQITTVGAGQDTSNVIPQVLNNAPMADTASGTGFSSYWEIIPPSSFWILIPLVIMSILAIYIFVERFLAINKAGKEENNFMNNIKDFMHEGKIDSAKALCRNNQSPIARMIEKGISRIGKPLGDINAAIETVGKLEVSKLEKGIAALATIAGAAPMLGFLGTVSGMINAFREMANAGQGNINIQLLSTGIYEAMITTLGGLFVGIIAYICYNILVARIEKVVFLLEARATEFMDLLHEPAK